MDLTVEANTQTKRVTVSPGTSLINSNTSHECVNRALYCIYSNRILLSLFWHSFNSFLLLLGLTLNFSSLLLMEPKFSQWIH